MAADDIRQPEGFFSDLAVRQVWVACQKSKITFDNKAYTPLPCDRSGTIFLIPIPLCINQHRKGRPKFSQCLARTIRTS